MSKRLLRRGLHAVAISAVAGASVLAPAAAVADDATAAGDIDTSATPAPAPEEQAPIESAPAEPAPEEQGPVEPAPQETEPVEQAPEVVPPAAEDGQDDTEAEKPAARKAAADDELTDAEINALVEEIMPDMGFGKNSQPIRVGASLAEGTFVPAGVTTAGTRLRITETGPAVDGGSKTTECTTEASTAEGTATYCVLRNQTPPRPPVDLEDILDGLNRAEARAARSAMAGPLAVVTPENPNPTQNGQLYLAQRTSTVTVTQLSAPAGLVVDPESANVEACGAPELVEVAPGVLIPADGDRCTRQVALVEASGLPPVAEDDAASTQEGTPVDIDVLANDDTVAGAPLTGFDLASAPANGVAQVVGTGEDAEIRYAPAEGFSGTDSFSYGIVTPNGVAFAEVTVEVEPAIEQAANRIDRAPATVGALPDAGGPGRSIFGWAAALMVAGGGALALGRRRDVHAG